MLTDPNINNNRNKDKIGYSISNFSGNISIQQLCDGVKIVSIDHTAELKLPGK